MPFWFAHALVAFEALQKLERKNAFSSFEQIDDYLFGSIAPDARYFKKVDRLITHKPFGKKSAFEAFKGKASEAFIAGYESHLICDMVWSGEYSELLDKSAYTFFRVNPNNLVEKFSLYFFVDDYFQGQSNWFYPMLFAGNVFRANETNALKLLNFNDSEINAFKLAATALLKEPGANFLQALNLLRIPLEEKLISETIKRFTPAPEYLDRFFSASVEKSVEAINSRV